jgi:aryl-alcohol dehydrogenase-like predicted oxidoreductase
LYDDLENLKESGKIRFAGVSLYSEGDIDFVLSQPVVDCLQIPFSLLDPYPFLLRQEQIDERKYGLIIRSALKSGFLSGKFNQDTKFTDPADNRSKMNSKEIKKITSQVDMFCSAIENVQAILNTAVAYVLSFDTVSTVILGTKAASQADVNFGELPGIVLNQNDLVNIQMLQKRMGLLPGPIQYKIKKIVDRILNKLN